MPADFSRSRRVGELIQRELATMLTREVKDPRLSLVSITAVDVTRDLGLAKVFYTLIDSDHDTEEVQQSLKKASGFFRYELGHRIKLRIVPQLDFRYDDSVIHGAQLSRLIEDAIEDDKKRHNNSDQADSDPQTTDE
ncbi:MAG: 30S ribosome-binding factor RbfA [Gammaproteobacteria bacterium]|nr:30S ribosome-binding factor RbfA [Gammaproteobacteria bacterium]